MRTQRDLYYWRIFATACSFVFFGLGGLVLGYLVFPLITLFSRSTELAARRCRYLIHRSFRVFVSFMTVTGVLTWNATGRELLARPGQLVVANHPTLIDIVFLIAMLPNATCIVKPSLYRNIFTRGPVSRAAYIANDTPEQLLGDCVKALESGATLVIFPEGTRSEKGQPGRFRRGAAYVFLQARCPLILACIESRPMTLVKHERWYQIPSCRPRFTLKIKAAKTDNTAENQQGDYTTARILTRQWRDYFVTEVTT
ncbi:MAG: 1-acyl-sn-glycerol-3-phosphate acyltransferase [Halieaceae bacterium]|nr:1-acyl-sn-glycerol-3-phosphate acyltransferase [Halieaceae bacterium]